jgi:aspartyl protease family protein
MNKNTVFLLFCYIGITFLLFLLVKKYPYVLSEADNSKRLLYFVIVLIPLIFGISNRNITISQALKSISIWVILFLLLVSIYSYQYEIKNVGKKIVGNIFPTDIQENQDDSITFYKNSSGHFNVDAVVGGQLIHFLLDTGATNVVLTREDATRIGVDVDNLNYNIPSSTANGMTWSASIEIEEIRIGSITIENVKAAVSKGGLDTSLLGMSFLSKLKKFEVSKGAITIWN